jgi:hypothetical protein
MALRIPYKDWAYQVTNVQEALIKYDRMFNDSKAGRVLRPSIAARLCPCCWRRSKIVQLIAILSLDIITELLASI